jgi:hypothetical protein
MCKVELRERAGKRQAETHWHQVGVPWSPLDIHLSLDTSGAGRANSPTYNLMAHYLVKDGASPMPAY